MNDTLTRLATALRLSYRVERELGAGGMATVYLAHDLKHDRDVAIKVLHPDLGAALGGERFLSEIRTTARLQHPHILPLLDSGEADGLLYYVMPLVTGETLRARLDRERQLPIADAVRIAREVASALDHAHRQNVIHRDIKPENVLLQDGSALVADFGIALAVQTAGGQRMTQTGLSLGTPSYMSPEQAMGERIIDARSDVYALGAVMYEMLTGDPPFSGNSVQAIVAKVLSERPVAPHVLRDTVPRHVEAAVLQALAKLPADRFATANELADALAPRDGTMSAAVHAAGANEWVSNAVPQRSVRRWQALAAISGIVAIATSALWLKPGPSVAAPVVRFTLPAMTKTVGQTTQPAVSPDGSIVAFADRSAGSPGVRLRYLDRDDTELIPGTQGASDLTFSPDGKMLAYVAEDLTVHVVSLDGRSATQIAKDASATGGIDWSDDGFVYFASETNNGAVRRVAATGGTPEVVVAAPTRVTPTGGGWRRSPVLVRGTNLLVYGIAGSGNADSDIVALDLKAKTSRVVGHGIRPVAVHNGWLLIARLDGSVVAVRFGGDGSAARGDTIPVINGVYSQDGGAFVALGENGTLVYQPRASTVSRLMWVSRSGAEAEVDTALTRAFQNLAISPQGTRVAMSAEDPNGLQSVWLYDFARHTMSRLTQLGAFAYRPSWSPDATQLAYSSSADASSERTLWSLSVDRVGSPTPLVRAKRHAQELSWAPSGRTFAYREGFSDASTLRDIYVMNVGDTTGRPLVATKADEFNPAISPDGKWLAYTSSVSGRKEVYLTPFPNGGAQFPVSTDGASSPVWAHSSRELYFHSAKGMIVATEILGNAANPVGAQHQLFDASRYLFDEFGKSYDVAPGDDKFLFIKPPPRASLSVVLNWWQEAAQKLSKSGK